MSTPRPAPRPARRRDTLTRPMSTERKIVATAANEFEAELISGVLTEAGIESNMELANTGMGGRFGGGGARDIYVRSEDFERASGVLSETQDPGGAEDDADDDADS